MFKIKLYFFLISIKTFFCGCDHIGNESFRQQKEKYKIEKVGKLPPIVRESSGLEIGNSDSTFFTMNDDTESEIYEISKAGKLINTFPIRDSKNLDWEDLCKDDKQQLYIGDFGNNFNNRKNLHIYITNVLNQDTKTEKIHFSYEDQLQFPPHKKDANFDCEAFFYFNDSLYLFSKNRGNKIEKLYSLPAKKGDYVAQIKHTTKLSGMVTAADISPDKTKFAILTYGYIYIFNIVNQQINFKNPRSCVKFPKGKQAEGLIFINNDDMLVTNENGHIFLVKKR